MATPTAYGLPPASEAARTRARAARPVRTPRRRGRSCRWRSIVAPVEQVEEAVAIADVDAWLQLGVPRLPVELVRALFLAQPLPQRVIRDVLEGAALLRRAFLELAEKGILDHQRGARHASRCNAREI